MTERVVIVVVPRYSERHCTEYPAHEVGVVCRKCRRVRLDVSGRADLEYFGPPVGDGPIEIAAPPDFTLGHVRWAPNSPAVAAMLRAAGR